MPINPKETSVSAEDSTVQTLTTFLVSFKVPVPVQAGCIVTIQLPDDFKLVAGNVIRIQGRGIFGKTTPLNFGLDESSRIIKITDQCETYSSANMKTEIEITQLRNPYLARTTKSF